ncbi:hypothetical protein J2S46_006989 [Kitasatospora herbaricolor]|nr:hypothetical protein [Kitasatospora herbaricolor]
MCNGRTPFATATATATATGPLADPAAGPSRTPAAHRRRSHPAVPPDTGRAGVQGAVRG